MDFLRIGYSAYFYLSAKANISLTATGSNSSPSESIKVKKLNSPNNLLVKEVVGFGKGIHTLTLGGIKSGDYLASFSSSVDGNYQATFQTDPYDCPFPADYTDVHGVFMGCVQLIVGIDPQPEVAFDFVPQPQVALDSPLGFSPPVGDPNCIVFGPNGCATCIDSLRYEIVNGVCTLRAASTCNPPKKLNSFGVCVYCDKNLVYNQTTKTCGCLSN